MRAVRSGYIELPLHLQGRRLNDSGGEPVARGFHRKLLTVGIRCVIAIPSSKSSSRVLRSLPPIEPLVLIVLAVGAASLWGFIETADAVLENETQDFDRWMVSVLRDPANPADPIGPLWMEEIARDVSALGGFTWITLATVVVSIYLWIDDKAHMATLSGWGNRKRRIDELGLKRFFLSTATGFCATLVASFYEQLSQRSLDALGRGLSNHGIAACIGYSQSHAEGLCACGGRHAYDCRRAVSHLSRCSLSDRRAGRMAGRAHLGAILLAHRAHLTGSRAS